jgi:hypothetical protein
MSAQIAMSMENGRGNRQRNPIETFEMAELPSPPLHFEYYAWNLARDLPK